MHRNGIFSWLLVGIAAVLTTAAPGLSQVPQGGEFQVNSFTTGDQYSPRIVALGDTFVVVWQEETSQDIRARRFTFGGTALGSEFVVNSYTTSLQWNPDLAAFASGDFVVVWDTIQSSGPDSGASVQAQRFSSDGNALGGEFQLNSYTTGTQRHARVAGLTGGDFVVVWHSVGSSGTDGFTYSVQGQRFAADGTGLGSQFQVNTYTSSDQKLPDVGGLKGGDFVVVWTSVGSSGSDTSYRSVQAQRYTSDGSAIGSQFQVNTFTAFSQYPTDVEGLADGGFVVAWDGGFPPEVRAQIYAADGAAVGSEFQVNTYTTGSQFDGFLASLPDGDFVASWWSYGSFGNDSSRNSIQGQRFDSGGAAVGGQFQVNTYTTSYQTVPFVAAVGAGDFVVAWASNFGGVTDFDVMSQRYRGSCGGSQSLTAGQWRMISLPCDPGTSNTVTDVFGDDLAPGDYASRWIVFERDAGAESNIPLTLADTLETGRGYWLKTLDAGQTVDVGDLANPIPEVALVADADGRQNLVGHPFPFDVCWADVRVLDGASVLTLDEADPAGECEKVSPGSSCRMSRIMHKWTGSAYAPFDGQTPGAEGTLSSFDALWVEAFKAGVKLRVPAEVSTDCGAGAGFAASESRHRRSRFPEGWYVRLIVESADLIDDGNVFGQLDASVDGYDQHDLPELDPFGDTYLTVLFPHPEWGERAGNYATDYHAASPRRQRDEWRFEVRASPEVERATLRWEGPPEELKGLRLVDEETHRSVPMKPGGSYSFELSGSSRSFSCRLGGAPRR